MTLSLVPPKEKLTLKEERFVLEFLKDGNATAAYKRCGYKSQNADVSASTLANKPKIKAEIERRRSAMMAKLERSTIATLGEVKEKLTSQLRGTAFDDEISAIRNFLADSEARVSKILDAEGRAPDPRWVAEMVGVRIDLIKAIAARESESGRAALSLARLKGALDSSRKPVTDRKKALDDLILAMVKSTDGETVRMKMLGAGIIDV